MRKHALNKWSTYRCYYDGLYYYHKNQQLCSLLHQNDTVMTTSFQFHTLPVVILNMNENVKEGGKGYKFIPFSPYIYSQNVPTKITF